MSEWKNTEAELPTPGQLVLALLRKKNTIGHFDVLEFTKDDMHEWAWKAPYTTYWHVEDVAYWMPLPGAP